MLKTCLTRVKDVLYFLNHESREVILDLPGVGPKRVDSILALRQACLDQGRTIRIKDIILGQNTMGPALLARLAGEENSAKVIKYSTFYQHHFCMDHGSHFQVDNNVLLMPFNDNMLRVLISRFLQETL